MNSPTLDLASAEGSGKGSVDRCLLRIGCGARLYFSDTYHRIRSEAEACLNIDLPAAVLREDKVIAQRQAKAVSASG